jgi:chaperonin GroES
MLNLSILDKDSYGIQNWAAHIDGECLEGLGRYVIKAIEADEESRRGWLEQNEMWVELAQQIQEEKNFPWPRAAAVKFPMLTTAALQFHARAHQELLKDERIVLAKVLGKDTTGEKAARGRRVEDAMSMQFLYRMEDWQDDMDRMLYVLPLVGTCFKKVYWSEMLGRPTSELVLPSEMVVSYYATDWDRARKTHILYKSHNEIVEQQRILNYLDVDIGMEGEPNLSTDEPGLMDDEFHDIVVQGDTPHEILECHCWYDLDEDGYEEPYIVTVDRTTAQVLRVVPRFRRSDVRDRADGVVMAIDSLEYIIPYKFFPSVDSNVYGTGFGQLLGPLNKAVNSLINQLMDAGTLSNLQSGFLGRGVRVSKGGRVRFRPGEWLELSSTGDDLRKGVYPLPVKEPNMVLFQLLGYLVQAGEQVSSVAEVMTGQNPGQNQPYSTTATVLEQGMQVFLGIYKRIYRSLAKEYRQVYNLNFMYLSDDVYSELLEEEAEVLVDFAPQGLDILPEADPNMANSMRKQARVQALIEAQRSGMQLNPAYIQRQFLEAIDEPNIQEVTEMEPPPPTAEELEDKRFYTELEYKYKELEIRAMQNEHQPLRDEMAALANLAKAKSLVVGDRAAQMELELKTAGEDNALGFKLSEMMLKARADAERNEIEKQKATQSSANPQQR